MPHVKSEEGYLSVTEVLNLSIPKPFLMYWYGKNGTEKCEQIKRESQEIGTEVHQLIEDRFNGKLSIVGKRADIMADNFWNKFVAPYSVKPKELEVTLKDKKLKLQGTFDGVIETSRGEVVGDWKTSNQIDKVSVPLQLSMYDYLRKGNGKGVVVRIDKESDVIQVVWYDDLPKYVPVWKACLKVARFIKFGLDEKEAGNDK